MHTLEEEVKGESSKIKKQVAQIRAFLSALVHIALEHKEFALVSCSFKEVLSSFE